GDQLVDQVRVTRIGGDRGLPVALTVKRRAGRLLGTESARPGAGPTRHTGPSHQHGGGHGNQSKKRARPQRTLLPPRLQAPLSTTGLDLESTADRVLPRSAIGSRLGTGGTTTGRAGAVPLALHDKEA